MINPFVIYGYSGPQWFCDRESELSSLIESFDNHRYLLLYSMRRLGKTGLIHHFHHTLSERKKVIPIYLDVQHTNSDQEFVSQLITQTISKIEKSQTGLLNRIQTLFSSLRPTISFDPFTNLPTVELQIKEPKQVQLTLDIFFEMLGKLNNHFQISIDEFQQIANYSSPSFIDAAIRGNIHKIKNTHFLFSGSQRHLLLNLFSNSKKPFFNMVDQLQLKTLDHQIYADFIQNHFTNHKQKIDASIVEDILTWTRSHTYHTQYFCNRLFAQGHKKIIPQHIEKIKREILYTFEPNYLQLRATNSPVQWKLLTAIAKEESVTNISSRDFLSRYQLAQSSAHQAMNVLLEKEILYEVRQKDKNIIIIYDPFFSRWLQEI
ncbi:MAG: ATP-binding protein [Saprospiraceae bacterium]|nr:ATP-binding protein [Saprospiraceae bacterium]